MVDTYVSDAYAPRVCEFKSHPEHQKNPFQQRDVFIRQDYFSKEKQKIIF